MEPSGITGCEIFSLQYTCYHIVVHGRYQGGKDLPPPPPAAGVTGGPTIVYVQSATPGGPPTPIVLPANVQIHGAAPQVDIFHVHPIVISFLTCHC